MKTPPSFAASLLCLALASASLGQGAPSSEGPANRLPPPAEAIEKASKSLRDIYGDRLDAATSADQRSLAAELLELGQKTADDPAAQWVCWDTARRLALAANDRPLSLEAARALSRRFAYPAAAEPTECLRRAREAWSEAESRKGGEAWPWRLAAWAWYFQAAGSGTLTGLEGVEAEKRIAAVEAEVPGAKPRRPVRPGLAEEDDWITLFDGRNLDAWQMGPDRSWAVENGAIALTRKRYNGKEQNADYLWVKEPYGDFILELEFRVLAQTNSGVFLRTADLSDPVNTGIEVQVCNSYGNAQLSSRATVGAVYDCQAPSKNAALAPGAWQRMRVTCRGSRITVEINGQTVNEVDLDRWTTPRRNPDGSANKFPRALKDYARTGSIGLQDHGRPVWYRNVRIRALD